MERHKTTSSKASPLPHDYLEMIEQVFTANFDVGLKAVQESKPESRFIASGAVFADEIVLCVSLQQGDQLSATSVYGSMEFDPKASSPTVQDLLALCVDAIGTIYQELLSAENPAAIEQLTSGSLSSLQNVPFDWSEVTLDKRKVFLKVDKANPKLDQLADDWLAQHDPHYQEKLEAEQKETEKLFVTGKNADQSPPSGKNGSGNGSGTLH